ncbi:hypothetical protein TNCV_3819951 [Trichonephila clavipes]|uniref:Uncharacterized protein n=1 Tax=Trichonephila clavipes TaxID=2585209 RepID=A0A8X6R487_TRICX|nr:hypothetical protein TNCV_3819951 [Trichonephila clavipes]
MGLTRDPNQLTAKQCNTRMALSLSHLQRDVEEYGFLSQIVTGIGTQLARDDICPDQQGRQRDSRSKELRPTGRQKKKDQRSRVRQGRQKGKRSEG